MMIGKGAVQSKKPGVSVLGFSVFLGELEVGAGLGLKEQSVLGEITGLFFPG